MAKRDEPLTAEEAAAVAAEAKAKADAADAAAVAAWRQTPVGRWVDEHLTVLQDRTGGRHRPS